MSQRAFDRAQNVPGPGFEIISCNAETGTAPSAKEVTEFHEMAQAVTLRQIHEREKLMRPVSREEIKKMRRPDLTREDDKPSYLGSFLLRIFEN